LELAIILQIANVLSIEINCF